MNLKKDLDSFEKQFSLNPTQADTSSKYRIKLKLMSTALLILIDKEIENKNILDSFTAYLNYFYNSKDKYPQLNNVYNYIDQRSYLVILNLIELAEDKFEHSVFFVKCKTCMNHTENFQTFCTKCDKTNIITTPPFYEKVQYRR